MDPISFFTLITRMYDSLSSTSIIAMLPFMIITPLEGGGGLYNFLQYKGKYRSKVFNLSTLHLKEFTFITPKRYFLNKMILRKILEYKNTGYYSIFISFDSNIKLTITLYNNFTLDIKRFKLKLFSGSFDLRKFDWITYIFMSKEAKAKYKAEKLKRKLEQYELFNKAQIEDKKYKDAYNKVLKLIKVTQKNIKQGIDRKNNLDLEYNNELKKYKENIGE